MKKLLLSMAALPLVIGGLSVSASADDGLNILNNIKVTGQIRPRFENVDDGSATTANANAYTARTKLSVTAGLLGVDGLTATLGGIAVSNFGAHGYNDGTTAYTDGTLPYTKITDPQDAMISNAAIDYTVNNTSLHAGRGQVNLDNQRFIGTVGWRQLERSYDSLYIANNSIKNLSVLVAWVYGYAGVANSTTADTNTVLLHAAYSVMPELKITAYDYMLANIHDTYGIALTGNLNLSGAKLDYRAEYAAQGDATMEKGTQIAGVTGKADADYYNLDLGANVNGILAGVNYEVFSGAANATETNFTTPLATGHKFNGWADVAGSANGGLQDFNIRLGYTANGLGKILALYHDFKADVATVAIGDDKGSEIDVIYTNKIPGVNNLTGLIKYADFSKGKVAGTLNDVQKIWVGLDYKFSVN